MGSSFLDTLHQVCGIRLGGFGVILLDVGLCGGKNLQIVT